MPGASDSVHMILILRMRDGQQEAGAAAGSGN